MQTNCLVFRARFLSYFYAYTQSIRFFGRYLMILMKFFQSIKLLKSVLTCALKNVIFETSGTHKDHKTKNIMTHIFIRLWFFFVSDKLLLEVGTQTRRALWPFEYRSIGEILSFWRSISWVILLSPKISTEWLIVHCVRSNCKILR